MLKCRSQTLSVHLGKGVGHIVTYVFIIQVFGATFPSQAGTHQEYIAVDTNRQHTNTQGMEKSQ